MRTTITRGELFDACRAIYRVAESDFMLPPLIQDAATLEAKPNRIFCATTASHSIRFEVELDRFYIRHVGFPLARLPLRFKIELCDRSFEHAEELGESERRELMKAFLLGASAPIIAEKDPHNEGYRIFIQFSSTYFLECGKLNCKERYLTRESVCGQVSLGLYAKTQEFFESAQEGLEAWSTRVAQDLFGDPRPAAALFWPLPSQDLLAPAFCPANAPVLARKHFRSVDCLTSPELINTVVRNRSNLPVQLETGRILTPPLSRSRRRHLLAAVAASVMVVGFGLATTYLVSERGFGSNPPEATAGVAGSMVSMADSGISIRSGPTEPVVDAEEQKVLSARPSGSSGSPANATQSQESDRSAEGSPSHTAPGVINMTKIVAHASILGARGTRTDALPSGRISKIPDTAQVHKNSERRLSTPGARPANPFTIVGQTMNSVTSVVASNLRQMAYRLSSLIGDQRLRRHSRARAIERS